MTETAEDGTIKHVKVVTINDDQEARVDEESQLRFVFGDPTVINDMALKCSGCQMVTVHQAIGWGGLSTDLYDEDERKPVSKRIVGCTNCGKIATK